MPSYPLGSVECVTLKDFSDLLAISFAINLALPIFRELIVTNRRAIDRRIPAIQSIVESRQYADQRIRQEHLAALTSVKVDLIAHDKDLSEHVTICSAVTFAFALASLFWIAHGIYNPACLDDWLVVLSVWLNFVPLPASVAFLMWRSRSLFQGVSDKLDALQSDLM